MFANNLQIFSSLFFIPPPVQFKQQLDEEKKARKIKDEEIQVLKGILLAFIIYFLYHQFV